MKKEDLTPNQAPKLKRKEQRYFSEQARITIVELIDNGEFTVAEITRRYQVSPNAVYKWIKKYSPYYQPPLRKVVEGKSEYKRRKELEEELSRTYELLGQSQAKAMLLEKVLELASAHYQKDLKKTFGSKLSNRSRKKNPGK